MDSIYDFNDQPIHFFYIHFLSLLTAIYLPIFAISEAYSAGTGDGIHWATDLLSGTIVTIQAIFVIGLRLLGQKMVRTLMITIGSTITCVFWLLIIFLPFYAVVISSQLDAYGDDLEDLSVLHYVREAWKTSNRMLSTQFPAPIVPDQEELNLREASTLGYPWDLRQRRQATATSSSLDSIV